MAKFEERYRRIIVDGISREGLNKISEYLQIDPNPEKDYAIGSSLDETEQGYNYHITIIRSEAVEETDRKEREKFIKGLMKLLSEIVIE